MLPGALLHSSGSFCIGPVVVVIVAAAAAVAVVVAVIVVVVAVLALATVLVLALLPVLLLLLLQSLLVRVHKTGSLGNSALPNVRLPRHARRD